MQVELHVGLKSQQKIGSMRGRTWTDHELLSICNVPLLSEMLCRTCCDKAERMGRPGLEEC